MLNAHAIILVLAIIHHISLTYYAQEFAQSFDILLKVKLAI